MASAVRVAVRDCVSRNSARNGEWKAVSLLASEHARCEGGESRKDQAVWRCPLFIGGT